MIKYILLFTLVFTIGSNLNAQEIILKNGMKISRSGKVKKQVYKLDGADSNDRTVILIEGENITIDFNNALLQGSNKAVNPDEFKGVAVLVRNSKNITIKNLKAKGYRIAILASDVESLTISNCDLSYNYRPRLQSTQQKEDIADWMSYHANEKDEWLRYGAAIYMKNCSMPIICDNKVTGGQNALMMSNCNIGMIYNNDFSFNSGIGIGMYRCSNNRVLFNKINFNVRGYSHGVYNRGQDSAGILVYEQSNKNLFYKNSVTHGGDGFFLWSGQSGNDLSKIGSNDNALIENDFSYAPTNGIEVTYSRNYIFKNRVYECDHGIWGGFSYNTRISNNRFRNNRIAIAIENGQENTIDYNLFLADKEAIRLWSKEQPSDWSYGQLKDIKSRDYVIALNSFNNIPLVFNIRKTQNVRIFENTFSGSEELFRIDTSVTGFDSTVNQALGEKLQMDSSVVIPNIEKPLDPFKGTGPFAGRKNIMITEWGPYDFKSPIIWNTNPTDSSATMQFDLLGPNGKWKIKTVRGLENVSQMSGELPAKITATRIKSARTDIFIEAEYTGSTAITTPFGNTIAAGKPYIFKFSRFFQPIDFTVRWYATDTSMHHPVRTGQLLPPNARLQPIKTEKVNSLDYAWWGGIRADKNYNQFVTLAEGSAELPQGLYELGITWDDAVRVYVDGKLVIDEWKAPDTRYDEAPHKKVRLELGGNHQFMIEHAEILGSFGTLSFKLNRLDDN